MKRKLAVVGSATALLTTIVCWPVVRSWRWMGSAGSWFVVNTSDPASTADAQSHNGDTRFITLRFGHWQWHVLAS